MVTKSIEILETNIDVNGQSRDRIRITITDSNGVNHFISEKTRSEVSKSHEDHAEIVKRIITEKRNLV